MFLLLFSLYLCDFQYSVTADPLYIDQLLPASKTICVNTSIQYTTFVFNALGDASFKILDQSGNFRQLGFEESYRTAAGVNFGKLIGSLVITAGQNQTIRRVILSSVVFPQDECEVMLISNNFHDTIHLLFEKSTVCYFNGNGQSFRYQIHIPHGALELRRPNNLEKLIYDSATMTRVDGYSPLFVYKPGNDSFNYPVIITIGENTKETLDRFLEPRIMSSEPNLLDGTKSQTCTDNSTTNSSDWNFLTSILNEKEVKLGISIVFECLLGISFFFYWLSLCYICPCCKLYDCCHSNRCIQFFFNVDGNPKNKSEKKKKHKKNKKRKHHSIDDQDDREEQEERERSKNKKRRHKRRKDDENELENIDNDNGNNKIEEPETGTKSGRGFVDNISGRNEDGRNEDGRNEDGRNEDGRNEDGRNEEEVIEP